MEQSVLTQNIEGDVDNMKEASENALDDEEEEEEWCRMCRGPAEEG